MAELVREFLHRIVDEHGAVFAIFDFGSRRANGQWEGWLQFQTADTVYLSTSETVQSNRRALEHWANHLSPVYLEGAFRRPRLSAGGS